VLTVIYLKLLGATGTVAHVTLFEAAMGPQIGGAIVATQYGLDPPLVTLMVGIGSAIGFLNCRSGGTRCRPCSSAQRVDDLAERLLGERLQ
jgi:hypothetical protein